MLVDLVAKIRDTQSLAPNHPIREWPVSVKVYQSTDTPKTILIFEGGIKVGELLAAVQNSRVTPPDNGAIPQFVKTMEARKDAEIHNLELSQIHLQSLIDSASFPYLS